MSRVLVVRLRALGDMVVVTPAWRALAAAGHEVHAVTEERFAPLLRGLPWLASVHGIRRTNRATLDAILAARRLRPERAIDFFGNTRSALIARGSGAEDVWGFDLRGRRRFYTHTVPRELKFGADGREYCVDVHLRLALAAGGVEAGRRPEIVVSAESERAADDLFERAGVADPARTVGVVVAGSSWVRALPVSHSVTIARRLAAAGHGLLVLGGPGEASITRRFRALVPEARELPDCGVGPLAAVVKRLRAVVGTNSGPQHIAAALGVPGYSFFGPLHPDTWSPRDSGHGFWRTDVPCRSCDRTNCAHWNCMTRLDPEEGGRRVLAHLEAHGR